VVTESLQKGLSSLLKTYSYTMSLQNGVEAHSPVNNIQEIACINVGFRPANEGGRSKETTKKWPCKLKTLRRRNS